LQFEGNLAVNVIWCSSGQALQVSLAVHGKPCTFDNFWQNRVEVLMLQNRPLHFIWHNALHSRASLALQGKPCISGQDLQFKATLADNVMHCRSKACNSGLIFHKIC
jgi:hypothetical protein